MNKNSFTKVAIATKPNVSKDIIAITKLIKAWCEKEQKPLVIIEPHRETEEYSSFIKKVKLDTVKVEDLAQHADLIISLGGDGTLIGVSRLSPSLKIPIIGVRMGRIGFLTEFTQQDFVALLNDSFKGMTQFRVPLFKAKVYRDGKLFFKNYFINDAVLHKNHISRMFSLSVDTKNQNIYTISGDGIIVSSPLGSTAYSLAAGGPLIYPDVKALTLTPICPHSLTHRPFVMPENREIRIELLEDPEFVSLTLDGQEHVELHGSDLVIISKNKVQNIRYIRNKNKSYFQNLGDIFTYGKRIKTHEK